MIEVEEVEFIQWVLKEVEREKFLTFPEFLQMKYYLDKVCLSILVCERDLSALRSK